MCRSLLRALRSPAFLALFACAVPLHAQLTWSVFNETTTTPAPASTASNGVALSVPAGQRATLVANNLAPIDLTRDGTEAYVTISFKVSGGLSGIAAGTRAIGFGLFNHNGTAADYADDAGYFTWLNGRNTGSLIEQRRRLGDGTSPSLLNPTGTAFNNLSTGQASPTPGSLNDGNIYSLTIHLMSRGGAISFGNTSANTTGGGVILDGPGIRAITFSNPDAPASAFVFNEIGFMFLNTTNAAQTLTIISVTSSSNSLVPINPPVITAQPVATSLNPGQAGSLSVGVTGTPPLTYQWRKDGANVAGATGATLNFANAAAGDAGNYSVVVTNAYGSVTSSAAALNVTVSPIPPTITQHPASATVNVGDRATFSAAGYGSAPLTFQWAKNGTDIAGATGTSYTIASVTAADAGSYTVRLANNVPTLVAVVSNPAVLGVNTAPAITTQPASVTTTAGQSTSFTVAATGSPTPIYQWSRNGSALAGATNATLTIANAQLADTGVYTVALINDVGSVTSAPAVLAIPSTMAITTTAPAAVGAVNLDAPLALTFDRPPVAGRTGRIRVFKASDDTVADTLDLGAALQQRTVGTNATLYNFIPVTISGNTATFYMRVTLAPGTAYYAQIEPSAILDSAGGSFTGISDKTTWRFTTKAGGPANPAALTVAADGSGDFNTVQGAIDSVPANNASRVVITVKRGTYNELVYLGATRPFITIRGEDRAQTIVGYANNNNLNGTTATRAAFSITANDTILETITVRNPTSQGGSQAEAVFTGAQRVLLSRVNLRSRQDTLLCATGTLLVTDSYIEGNTDFIWGSAAAYFNRCELRGLDTAGQEGFYTQSRTGQNQIGFVFVECRLTGEPAARNYYLGRIDPNPGNFPFSQAVWIDCAMGPHILPVGWQLNNATTSATVQEWEYQSTDLAGATLDVRSRHASSRQIDTATAARYRDPAFVLGGWSPQVAAAIEVPPAATTFLNGSNAHLTVQATGFPAPSVQWFWNGAPIAGATAATLSLPAISAADAGAYHVVVSGAAGNLASAPVSVGVRRGEFAGVYFAGQQLNFTVPNICLYVRDDGTGVAFRHGADSCDVTRALVVDAQGNFDVRTLGAPVLPFRGRIAADGTVTGEYFGGGFSGRRDDPAGPAQALAGYYLTGVADGSAITSFVVGASGTVFVCHESGPRWDGGVGRLSANSTFGVTMVLGGIVTATFASDGSSANARVIYNGGTQPGPFVSSGSNDRLAHRQRLGQLSARVQVGATSPAIAGFVVRGDRPLTALVRAIGPTLGAFNVPGFLTNPRLEFFRGADRLALNAGWGTASNAAEIAQASAASGAFALPSGSADSAVLVTLNPGAYSAVVSSASGVTSGVALIEVYDLSRGDAGQRLVNLSARGSVGPGAGALITGLNVASIQPKRMLLRALGPTLAPYGVANALPRPVLSLFRGSRLLVSNEGWRADFATSNTTSASTELDLPPLFDAESALLVNLPAGNYTAVVTGSGVTAGTALVEIYELP